MPLASWIAWLRWSHRWIGLLLMIPLTVVAATGVLLVHESLWAGKEATARQPSKKAAVPADSTAPAGDLLPEIDAWHARLPAIEAALKYFRTTHGSLPLREVRLQQDHAYGWIVKVKSLPGHQTAEREILWAADRMVPIEVAKPGSAEFYRAPGGGWNWKKLVKDLHTGQVFGGLPGTLWADAAGLSIVLLGLTGFIVFVKLWLTKRSQRTKPERMRGKSNPDTSRRLVPHVALTGKGIADNPSPDLISKFTAQREGW